MCEPAASFLLVSSTACTCLMGNVPKLTASSHFWSETNPILNLSFQPIAFGGNSGSLSRPISNYITLFLID